MIKHASCFRNDSTLSLPLTLCISFASPVFPILNSPCLPTSDLCTLSSALLVLFVELRFNTTQFKGLVVSHFLTTNNCQDVFFVTYDVRDNLVRHFFAILPRKKPNQLLFNFFSNTTQFGCPSPRPEGKRVRERRTFNLHGPSLCHI